MEVKIKKKIKRIKKIIDTNSSSTGDSSIKFIFISSFNNTYNIKKPIKINITKLYYKDNCIFFRVNKSNQTSLSNNNIKDLLKKKYTLRSDDIIHLIKIYKNIYIVYLNYDIDSDFLKKCKSKNFIDFYHENKNQKQENDIYNSILKSNAKNNYLDSIFMCKDIKIKVKDIYYYLIGYI